MKKITTSADLKIIIQQLEYKKSIEWPLLKEQFLITYESFKLINILKHTIKGAVSEPDLKNNLVNAAIGLSTGFITKKLVIGKTHNPLLKLLGIVVEIAVADKVAKNTDGIKSIGNVILRKIFNHRSSSERVL